MSKNNYTLGIDLGTSGIRCVIIDEQKNRLFQHQEAMPFPTREGCKSEQAPQIWLTALDKLLTKVAQTEFALNLTKCILDATSSTVLLCRPSGQPLTLALMYDDRRAQSQANQIAQVAPKNSGAHGASSTLAKVMWLETQLTPSETKEAIICHQIDFINHFLTGRLNITDENNALKLGYDSTQQDWPSWSQPLIQSRLPQVKPAGTELDQILPSIAQQYHLNPNLMIYTGTTDSIAAFLATGASEIGDTVTSLGSTLAIKSLTSSPIFAPEYGIYSHHLRDKWLVGGASNAGGAILLNYFDLSQIEALLPQIEWQKPTGLDYYPLNTAGERFPIADPNLPPKLTPRPKEDALFLQGILEGLVNIEYEGYQKMQALGSDPIKRLFTCGGGTKNSVWMKIRAQTFSEKMSIETKTAPHIDAAFGVTQLLF